MSSPLRSRARRYLTDAARAFEQAPVEGVVVLILAVAFSYSVETGDDAFPTWAQFLVVCLLLLAGAWTGTLRYTLGIWPARARWAATAAGAAAAALYGFLVPDFVLQSEVWRAALLAAVAVLWIVAMPALGAPRAEAVDRVRVINGRFLLRAIGAVLYSGALFAGLALALAAIDNLFELNLEETIYAHVWGWLFLVLAPSIVVGGLADYARPVTAPTEVAGVIHRMTAFLVPPLLALYYAILYAYTIRMAVTGEVPKNLLSPLVLAAGALGTLTLYLFEPRPNSAAGSRYLRYVPPLFLPLAALGIWAVALRTDQYGWTENRLARLLVLVVLAALAAGASIQLVRRRRLALHVAPLALAVALLLAGVGPWSALAIARRSQQARLVAVMAEAGVPATSPGGTVRGAARTIPTRVYDEFRDIAHYLAQHFGAGALPPVLAALIVEPGASYDLPLRLGLQRAVAPHEHGPFRSAQLQASANVDAGGVSVQRVVLSDRPVRMGGASPERRFRPQAAPGVANATLDATQLRMRNGNELLSANLDGLIGILAAVPGSGDLTELAPDQARLDVTDATGRRRGTLVVFSVNGQLVAGTLRLTSLDAVLLLDR